MKLAVIGEPCMDYIHSGGNNSTRKQFGGILYSVVSLAVIAGSSAEVYPVMNLGADEYDNVTEFLKKFPNIKTGYINRSPHKTRIVNLYYDKDSISNNSSKKTYDREENSTEPTLPVEFELIEPALGMLDGILVNLVSGVDLTLDTLQNIRKNFSKYIHMDLHNLVMQTFPDGRRKQFPVENWSEWCNTCNTLQMNESEIAILTGGNVTEYETAGNILSGDKVKAIVVTRGKQGVSIYRNNIASDTSPGNLGKIDVPRIDSPGFIDSTGCGDVFASAFFYKNAETNSGNYINALHFANHMASLNASLAGVEELHKLNN